MISLFAFTAFDTVYLHIVDCASSVSSYLNMFIVCLILLFLKNKEKEEVHYTEKLINTLTLQGMKGVEGRRGQKGLKGKRGPPVRYIAHTVLANKV